VTAGAPDVSPVLAEQLKDGGILVIPVGSRYSQSLYKVTKKGNMIERKNSSLCFCSVIGKLWLERKLMLNKCLTV
jgi:protein-L-isoaspartate(D-aspartate) O-methyltransferase